MEKCYISYKTERGHCLVTGPIICIMQQTLRKNLMGLDSSRQYIVYKAEGEDSLDSWLLQCVNLTETWYEDHSSSVAEEITFDFKKKENTFPRDATQQNVVLCSSFGSISIRFLLSLCGVYNVPLQISPL